MSKTLRGVVVTLVSVGALVWWSGPADADVTANYSVVSCQSYNGYGTLTSPYVSILVEEAVSGDDLIYTTVAADAGNWYYFDTFDSLPVGTMVHVHVEGATSANPADLDGGTEIDSTTVCVNSTLADTAEFTCSSFTASGITGSPYVAVEIWDPETEEDLLYEAYPANGDGTFDIDVVFDEVPEGTNLERWIWGVDTNDPDDYDQRDYYFEEGACVAAAEETPPVNTPPAFTPDTPTAGPAPVAEAQPAFTG